MRLLLRDRGAAAGIDRRTFLQASAGGSSVTLADGREFALAAVVSNSDAVRTHRELLAGRPAEVQTVIDGTLDKANYKMSNAIWWAENHPSNQMPPKELIAE